MASSERKNWQNATIVRCSVCRHYISEHNYDLHTQASHHRATLERFKDRIDFKTLQIFPSSLYNTTTEFLSGIHKDFTILMDHLLLKYTVVFVDFSITVLCQEKSLVVGGNNNINAIKQFYVHRQELTKNTNLHNLCSNVVMSLLIQCEEFQMSGQLLESLLFFKITVLKKSLLDEVASRSLVNNCYNDYDKTGLSKKTKPLQISRCKLCNGYVNPNNHQQHLETTAHQISLCYQNNEILFNHVKTKEDCILNCRFAQKHDSIDSFFHKINLKLLDLIKRTINLQSNGMINVNTKIFLLYSQIDSSCKNIGDIKTFCTKKEALSKETDLSVWFQNMSSTLNGLNEECLKTIKKTHNFDSTVFYDIYFYELTDNAD